MTHGSPFGLILLSYKGKVLLMMRNTSAIDFEDHEWSLISIKKGNNESVEQSIYKNVQKATNIKVGKIELVSNNLYHARLTDDDVNNIKREELQVLNFFTLSEVKKLTLSPPTKDFMSRYGNVIL